MVFDLTWRKRRAYPKSYGGSSLCTSTALKRCVLIATNDLSVRTIYSTIPMSIRLVYCHGCHHSTSILNMIHRVHIVISRLFVQFSLCSMSVFEFFTVLAHAAFRLTTKNVSASFVACTNKREEHFWELLCPFRKPSLITLFTDF